ncbi:MAG TPA: hypothetical protein PLP23_16145 [Panacibacter sp.]|nr:hypothetical protein [Panacibacter sp.]
MNITIVGPVIILSLPVYVWSKWLEKKINPRKSGKKFLLWVLALLATCGFYFWLCLFIWFKFFSLKA